MGNLVRSELFRLSHRLMSRFMLIVLVSLIFASYVVIWTTSGTLSAQDLADTEDKLSISRAPEYGMAIAAQVSLLLGVVLAASSISTEYSWGTVRMLLSKVDRRSNFLGAKLVTIGAYLVCLGFVSLIAVLLSSLVVTAAGGLNSSLPSDFVTKAILSGVRLSFVIMPYAALAFLVSMWSRATAAGIAVVIVAFYAEVLLGPLFTSSGALSWFPEQALIYRNVTAVLDLNSETRDVSLPGAWQATGVLIAYVIGFVSLAFWRFQTRDVTLN